MISVEEALDKILSFVPVLQPEEKLVLDCLGQVLAQDVYADFDIPLWDNSAMDGYAVRASDTCGASKSSPSVIPIVGEVAAGATADKQLEPGTAIRIMTGAPLPEGADAVVQFEYTDELSRQRPFSQIGVLREVKKGLNVRRRGEDIAKDTLILKKGATLRPADIGVLASLGYITTSVIRRPIISVLATGDELIDAGQPLLPGKIYDSNTYTIAAEVLRYGGIPQILGIGRDSMESLNEKIDESLASDMLITCGGVSLGNYDMVKDVLAKRGEIALWTVRMKPGKPSAFGVIRAAEKGLPHLGLPGNPVSAMVTFEQFARPAILKMMGREDLAKPAIQAIMDEAFENTDGRRLFARVVVTKVGEEFHARLTGVQGSGVLTSVAKANGLAVIPEDTPEVKVGDRVLVQMLDW